MKLIRGILILSAVFLTACNKDKEQDSKPPVSTQPHFTKEGELTFYKPDGSAITKINIEIAETDAEQQQGLMNRPFMNNDQGMLFIFGVDEPRSFWMHNTIIPLDIMYVNSGYNIVHIAENTEPFSDKTIPSGAPAKYVIEVNAGFSAQYGITSGCKVQFSKM